MTFGKVLMLIVPRQESLQFLLERRANKACSRKIAVKVSMGTAARCTNPRLRAKTDIPAAIN